MNNKSLDIWIGCLPIGRDLNTTESFSLLASLPSKHHYILDLSDIYANGNAISIIIDILDSLPSNIQVSLKLGLNSSFDGSRFAVQPRSWKRGELYNCFCTYTNLLPISRIHSFQLHALPDDDLSVFNSIECIKRIKSDFPVDVGIANIEVDHYLAATAQLCSLDFVQIHANVIEQRLIHAFTSIDNSQSPSYLVLNRVFCRGLLNNLNHVFKDPSSRYNVSKRIQSSLTEERLQILTDIHKQCQEFAISIHELSLGFCFLYDFPIRPILGGKNLDQFLHSIHILENFDMNRIQLISRLFKSFSATYSQSILANPAVAFER